MNITFPPPFLPLTCQPQHLETGRPNWWVLDSYSAPISHSAPNEWRPNCYYYLSSIPIKQRRKTCVSSLLATSHAQLFHRSTPERLAPAATAGHLRLRRHSRQQQTLSTQFHREPRPRLCIITLCPSVSISIAIVRSRPS